MPDSDDVARPSITQSIAAAHDRLATSESIQRLPNMSGDPSVRIEVIYLAPSHLHFAAAPDSNTSVPGFAVTPT
ncbi:hypothetical protein BCCH1_76960 (plasmid) [Burkholderia contaminans]|uniref:Uncharacterized protein n=1 Tax=Burkholderia contaminans TaxID=488447 RepID=A0A250LKS9_9BURK|nr:hypothetical protein BCCH1_76960 [Burkholderia contaminans]